MHNPGSPEAQRAGCTCPSEPNQGGTGAFTIANANPSVMHFVIEENCPMHGKAVWREGPSAAA